jgi:hypothetical protein
VLRGLVWCVFSANRYIDSKNNMKKATRKRVPQDTKKRNQEEREEEVDTDLLDLGLSDAVKDSNGSFLQGIVGSCVLAVYLYTLYPSVSGGEVTFLRR